MIIEGQGHFFIIYFPGFVCFVLYLAKISGERLQDHWSSGLSLYKLDFSLFLVACDVISHICREGKQKMLQIKIIIE